LLPYWKRKLGRRFSRIHADNFLKISVHPRLSASSLFVRSFAYESACHGRRRVFGAVYRRAVGGTRRRGDGVLARGVPELAELGARVARGDLQDADAVKSACAGMDAVFHVAAKAGVWGAWTTSTGVNVVGTQNVIAACQATASRN
jgi:hypothetical protein